ncbi:acyl-CoA carboxylase subunit epsilon [Streptomyces sp. NPDC002088]|uniref:acyl-CoA carboxylase subunit epsilon n=1 Tax=Streptomyces sp. NPDC002088 TaxID=3154665 RepID=UPI003322871D
MSTSDIRVEKGHAEPEEVAAITAILLTRAAAQPSAAPVHHGRTKAGWHRLERTTSYNAPYSWRS